MTTGHSRRAARSALVLAVLALPMDVAASQALALSPAVVPLRGRPGQSTRQTLVLGNQGTLALAFELEARDVVVRDGRRVLLPAGELPGSIAGTAVFSAQRVDVAPGQRQAVDVTLTLPPGVEHRAVVVLFRGVTRIAGAGKAGATASLGTLLTFTLSDGFSVAPSPLTVSPQTASSNLAFEQAFANDGSEPVVLEGVTVILDEAGAMVGRVPSEPRRLLPGERAALRADYAGELPPGRYRALSTFGFEGRAVVGSAEFRVP